MGSPSPHQNQSWRRHSMVRFESTTSLTYPPSKTMKAMPRFDPVITGSNRGIAFMVFDGGYVSDVVLSNLTIECRRHDWFWWGDGDPIHFNIKRRSEVDGTARANEPPAGSIRNVLIQNVVAHGQGTSMIHGHPDSW